MVSFRRRASIPSPALSETDSERLLASKRRGLFGRKSKDGDSSDRSNEDARPLKSSRALSPFKRRKQDTEKPIDSKPVVRMVRPKDGKRSRSMSPFKRRLGRDTKGKEAGTPPVTPEKNDLIDDPPLQVKLVTVKVQSPEPGRENHDEDQSVMSDLTDNRTYKRLADYKQNMKMEKEAAQFAEAEAAASAELSAIPEEKDKFPTVKARMEKVQAAQIDSTAAKSGNMPQNQEEQGQDNMNPMAFLFSYMDRACTTPSDGPGINKAYSFVPEWGMAPSRDERDKRVPYDGAAFMSDDEEDDEIRQSLPSGSAKALTHNVKDEIHENFEMVLEDLASTEEDLAHQKQQRNWMGAMNFRKNGEKVDTRGTEKSNDQLAPSQMGKAFNDQERTRAVKGGAERVLPPLAVEEEKKEEEFLELDSDNEEEPTREPSGARKMGNKILKSFRRLKKPKGELPPVSEGEEFDEGAPAEIARLTVRVPETNKALSETDLIGDDVVQDIYRDLEASIDPASRPPELVKTQLHETSNPSSSENRAESPLSQSTANSAMPSNGQTRSTYDDNEEDSTYADGDANNMLTSIMSLLNGGNQKEVHPEVSKIPDKGDIPKSKSWVDQFRLTLSEDTYETTPPSSATRQDSTGRQRMPFQQKMLWREVIDPKSGRPYYYHRITREVTWKLPQEMIEYEEARRGAKKDDDRRLVSVLSDGDLAAAATARDEKSRTEADMRKKNARDFDPDVWAIKEQIVKLLQTMKPPDGSSVEEVLKQYEGREESLLQQLRNMKEARPFDEPVPTDSVKNSSIEEGKRIMEKSEKSKPLRRQLSATRSRSDLAQSKQDRSKSAPRLRNASSQTKVDPRKKKAAESNESKATDTKRSGPSVLEKKAEEPAQIEAVKSFDPPAIEPSRDGRDAPEVRKQPVSPTRNVARAMRARLAARRANTASEGRKDEEKKSVGNQAHEEFDSMSADSSRHDIYQPEAFKNRIRTSGSGVASRVSEKTELIKNTGKKQSVLNTVGEVRTVGSDATSLSSTGLEPRVNVTMPSSLAPIPGKITAPRTRELMVEEFSTSDRSYKAEHFDKKRTVRAGRFGTTNTRRKPFTTPSPTLHDGDDSTKTDSVSALSIDDNSKPYYHKGGVDSARRRALDEAIAREDWDLAAALSDAMRTLKAKPVIQPALSEWKQSELDRFISQNDWDAVANYIASVRAKTKQNPTLPPRVNRSPLQEVEAGLPRSKRSSRRRQQPLSASNLYDEADELMMGNPKKRFGARSQLQHNEIHSESSWDSEESSYSSEDYSSASSFSESSSRRGKNRYRYASKHSRPVQSKNPKPKEFAC